MKTSTLIKKTLCLVAGALSACSSSGNSASVGSRAAGGPGGAGVPATTSAVSARFFLPTEEPINTAAPSVEVDAQGGLHAVYPAYAKGGAFYAYCPASCADRADVKVAAIPTDLPIHNAMLALDRAGRPRLLLATGLDVRYATCDGDCSASTSWRVATVLTHGGAREVTGEAFSVDLAGRPRFLMHTTKAFLGVGQKPPEALWVACDAGCEAASNWHASKIASEMWRGSSLRFDNRGVAKVATVVTVGASASSSGTPTGGYLECASACDTEAGWTGIALVPAFESEVEAVSVKPSISLALTATGAPRVAMLGMDDFKRNVTYFECDADCIEDRWRATRLVETQKLGAGIDLALDGAEHPRFVHTVDYSIGLGRCDSAQCGNDDSKWVITKVENGSDMKPDEIFLYDNCTVGAWFLHSPSLAITPDGRPRVGYQARDISGGTKVVDKTKGSCVAGTDMTWSRLALLPSAE